VTAYISRPDSCDVHPAGWLALPSGVQITCMPLVDRETSLYARLSPVQAAAWCAARGMRLPSAQELDQLHVRALHIDPVTLPTMDMLRAAGVPTNNQAAIDSYRNAHMRSKAWCEAHDEEVSKRLARAKWNLQPCANCGKHWTTAGGIYGWWQSTGRRIQHLSYAHRSSTHTDYATTTHAVRPGEDTGPRRTSLGERGADVEAWQRHLRANGFDPGTIDGVHGAKTEAATVALAASRATVLPSAQVEFIEARNYTRTSRAAVDLVVLHSTENPIRPGTARNVARWFGGPSAPQASAHYVVGPDEVIRCVPEQAVAWAAPGANRQGIQIEMVGQAAKTDWARDGRDDTAGLGVMRRSAELVRGICERWHIPLERVDAAGLVAGKRGITTHASVTEAFKRSTHIDPGCQGDARWPWDQFLAMLRK